LFGVRFEGHPDLRRIGDARTIGKVIRLRKELSGGGFSIMSTMTIQHADRRRGKTMVLNMGPQHPVHARRAARGGWNSTAKKGREGDSPKLDICIPALRKSWRVENLIRKQSH